MLAGLLAAIPLPNIGPCSGTNVGLLHCQLALCLLSREPLCRSDFAARSAPEHDFTAITVLVSRLQVMSDELPSLRAGKELMMADGDVPPSSAAQPLSSTGELALPGNGTVTSSGRRCDMLLLRRLHKSLLGRGSLWSLRWSGGPHNIRGVEDCKVNRRLPDVSLTRHLSHRLITTLDVNTTWHTARHQQRCQQCQYN